MNGKRRGFSLFEMLIVVAIIGVIALAAVPVAEITFVRNQEELLQQNLDQVRQAIEDYKRDCRNYVVKQVGSYVALWAHESLFHPPELKALFNPDPAGYNIDWTAPPPYGAQSVNFKPLKYLESIPADPFIGHPRWTVHFASGTSSVIYENGTHAVPADHVGVFDISIDTDPVQRKGFVNAIDGSKYEDW